MEIIALEIVLTLVGVAVGSYAGIKSQKKQEPKRNIKPNKTISNNLDIRYIHTSNIGIGLDKTIKNYYDLDINIIFDFSDKENPKEYIFEKELDKECGFYFIDGNKKIKPHDLFYKNNESLLSTLIKVNKEELKDLLESVDISNYKRYVNAYLEQLEKQEPKKEEVIVYNRTKKKTIF